MASLIFRLAILSSCLIISLSGCHSFQGKDVSDNPGIALKNSAIVVSIAGDYRGYKHPGGGVAFYDPQKNEWSKLSNAGAQTSDIDFRDGKLYFGDYDTDYILSDTLVKIHRGYDSPYNENVKGLKDGGFVAAKNIKMTDDGYGYEYRIVESHDGQTSRNYPYMAWISSLQRCEDDSMWSVVAEYTRDSDKYPYSFDSPLVLIKVTPQGSEEVVLRQELHAPQGGAFFQCIGHKIIGIQDIYSSENKEKNLGPEDAVGSILVIFDTQKNTVQQVRISGYKAQRINKDMFQAEIAEPWYSNGEIYWISGDGEVISTNIETGVNTKRFDLDKSTFGKSPSEVKDQGMFYWGNGYLYNLYMDDSLNHNILRIYDIKKGEVVKKQEIPKIDEVVSKSQFPYKMIVTNEKELLKS
ncbi:MAG: hypothetical protein Q4P78_00940 [Rothia sp. (in: high G+C Gram-positive bacteria)]|uniref:hypothetical protein n=1 Tax=Rothia sp. (in: high G+C Gram-positive bacteria) TaxID=1885016 RepID=UPI0026E0E05E|nr:hypothetical protein [Rothia sp. (in: high G+C Gram-positive bacteria)]MDO5749756.1 hypothetical protein [Rothia sp. (in: high G+C Gram-positive bacteria)]